VESEGGRSPATSRDAERWARTVGVDFPVLADKVQALQRVTGYTGPIPYRCALTPDMVMIECYQGEPRGDDPALQAILDHKAANAAAPE